MMQKKILNISGFTLIELLVVIAIIGVLAAIILATISSSRTRARDSVVVSSLSNYRSEAQLVFENGFTNLCSSPSLSEIQSYIESQGGTLESCDASIDEYRIVIGLPSSFTHTRIPTVYAAGEDGFCINSKGDALKVIRSEVAQLPSPLCIPNTNPLGDVGDTNSYTIQCVSNCSGGKCSADSFVPTCYELVPTMTGKGLINMKQIVPLSFCSHLATPTCG